MKKLACLFSLISFSVWAQTTSTQTLPQPMATATLAPVATVAPAPKTAKAAKKVHLKKAVVGKKTQARKSCIEGNPSLKLAKNKKRLHRCIKRKLHH